MDNLPVIIERGGIDAPNHVPCGGLDYRTIHDVEVQVKRHQRPIACGPGGVVHDYVPFYFGPRSPMLLRLKTGQVEGYNEGQEPLVYLVSSAQAVAESGARFVFSDGHGLAAYTEWFDDLARLDRVDWAMVQETYWADTVEDPDRQRRKQAEFLIHEFCAWPLVRGIGVLNQEMANRVQEFLERGPSDHRPVVKVKKNWYY